MNNNEYKFSIQGEGGSQSAAQMRLPVTATEGAYIFTGFPLGGGPSSGAFVTISTVQIVDLLCEGPVDGIVSGLYTYKGTLGNIGYDSVSFSGYPIASGVSGNFLQSIYWNEVPVVDTNNLFNYQSANVTYTPGRPNGSAITERISDRTTVSRSIGERLRGGEQFSKFYRILNNDCNGFQVNVRFDTLNQTDTNRATFGDTDATQVNYNIFHRPLYSNISPGQFILDKSELVFGNITAGYIRQTEVSLPLDTTNQVNANNFIGWEIKITRTTDDSIDSFLRNATALDSITELYGNTFVYPNSSVVFSAFSAEFFTRAPNRAYDIKMLQVLIPANYNPITKQYATTGPGTTNGFWDGTFASNKQWTDNPAWCFYDLVTSNRYGLGQYIDSSYIDKWTLYDIGKYCDTMVSDGLGGVEPYFTCNLLISSRQEAYKVLNDMASIFRAISFYTNGGIYLSQDSPKLSLTLFTNANVENGDFNYSTSSRRVRHTVALVRYNDKNNYYKPAVEYIENVDGIKQYGIRQLELTAFGCSSRGQAIRLGRWALLTETTETESVAFTAGLGEGTYLRPGDLFSVNDFNRKNKRFAGRLNNIVNYPSGSIVTLDSNVTGFISGLSYNLSIMTPTYSYDPVLVTLNSSADSSGIRRSHIQTVAFSGSNVINNSGLSQIFIPTGAPNYGNSLDTGNYNVSGNLIWSIEASSANVTYIDANQTAKYRVINIQEKEDFKYAIQGIQYNPDKYLLIESGLNFQNPNFNIATVAPTNLTLSLVQQTPNSQIIDYSFNISSNVGVGGYYVYGKNGTLTDFDTSGKSYLLNIMPPFLTTGAYLPLSDGNYNFRIYSANLAGNKSASYASSSILVKGVNQIKDVIISSLSLSSGTSISDLGAAGTRSTGYYSTAEPEYKWQFGFQGNNNLLANIMYRVSFREPSNNNIPNNNIYYVETGYIPQNEGTPSYKFTFAKNTSAIGSINSSKGPFREYDVVVEAMTNNWLSSAGGNCLPDALYNNNMGYDILYSNIPKITNILLSDATTKSLSYTTTQSIDAGGNISLTFKNFTYPQDTAGGYIYYSLTPFTSNDVISYVRDNINPKGISKFQFIGQLNTILVPAVYNNVSFAYIALSLYDVFDSAVAGIGTNILPNLFISNTVAIQAQGNNASIIPGTWQAYFEMDSNGNLSPALVPLGFIGVPMIPNATNPSTFNAMFTTPLDSANYSIVNTERTTDGLGTSPSPTLITVLTKTKTGFTFSLTKPSNNYNSLIYIGIIMNTSPNNPDPTKGNLN